MDERLAPLLERLERLAKKSQGKTAGVTWDGVYVAGRRYPEGAALDDQRPRVSFEPRTGIAVWRLRPPLRCRLEC